MPGEIHWWWVCWIEVWILGRFVEWVRRGVSQRRFRRGGGRLHGLCRGVTEDVVELAASNGVNDHIAAVEV